MSEPKRKERICYCARGQFRRSQKRRREQCKRKRQTFVYNPEEELWHEPYMRDLRREFSAASVLCDSKIELPWRDIALPAAGMRIRKEVLVDPIEEERSRLNTLILDPDEVQEVEEPPKAESSTRVALPWQDLVITETVKIKDPEAERCDSSLEIPWDQLILVKPLPILQLDQEKPEPCPEDDVEIPWDDLLIPRNIVIEAQVKRQHPSSTRPPSKGQPGAGAGCSKCKTCLAKVASRVRPTCT